MKVPKVGNLPPTKPPRVFTGIYFSKVQKERKIIMPRLLRPLLRGYGKKGIILVVDFKKKGHLTLFTPEAWQKRFEELESQEEKVMFATRTFKVSVDNLGKFVIPLGAWEVLGFENQSEIVIVGACDRIEIYSRKVWESLHQDNIF